MSKEKLTYEQLEELLEKQENRLSNSQSPDEIVFYRNKIKEIEDKMDDLTGE